ncbi:Chaperone protein DnaJ [Colletotrichum orbiculare MAFF 240422]|uniref:Chaperone protein DnaJ n=1 Tax=Colletotrichum orbiculare (strain 104-T / ATCC 96160 / CBS 514.97 / LARS 414 / MAFF 240422) TaxID=1213857 RepID=A0A484FV27_COLOR|nr:Chaperone protein DnaJ [Colletotrichum orbiculare MAFF 240422]
MTSLPPDPYKILGVSKDAQLPEIRSAHRKLVLRCHPDKVQDPTLKAAKQDEFQKVQQAYELLSDENERIKYDDNVKLAELRSQMAAKGMSANTSRARTFDVNIRTAEPRPDSFNKPSASYRSPGNTKIPMYDDSRTRRATTTYDKPSRQDDDREREKERERRRRKDDDREREREREREQEELIRTFDRNEPEKERDKNRKRDSEDKSRRQKAAYVEHYEEDLYVKEKKPSSKDKERRARSAQREAPRDDMAVPPVPALPSDAISTKMTNDMYYAASYMDKSRKIPLSRSKTYANDMRFEAPVAVPTPPAAAPFAPPPIPTSDDDVRRSKSRRSSETKTREKSSHKKSPAKDGAPFVVEASPSGRPMGQYVSSHSPMASSPPKISRAQTFHESHSRPPPVMSRSKTFDHDIDARGRHRSRQRAQVGEESESEDEPRHRGHRYVEPVPLDYGRTRYAINGSNRTQRIDAAPARSYYPEDYYDRPAMPSRDHSYASTGFKVKTARGYNPEDVSYSNVPHVRYQHEDGYAF